MQAMELCSYLPNLKRQMQQQCECRDGYEAIKSDLTFQNFLLNCLK